MDKTQKIISKYLLLIILILSIPAVRYLFMYGYFGVSDDLHIGWLFEMDRVINSVKFVFGLSIPVSMYFMYKLLKHFMPEDYSLAGAVLYVYAPYRALEMFVRGTIGEIVAFVFFPLIIYSVVKRKPYILALTFAGLILSHNIMAYMFMPFLLLFTILNRSFLVSLKGLLLGLLCSVCFWLPAIYESTLMKYDTVFNFYDHFPALKQFITPYWGYGASVPGNYDTMSFYMGPVGILVVVIGSIIFLFKRNKYLNNEKIFIIWSILVCLVSIFMMNFRSAWLWRNLPLLPYFQFPWRFLAMITLVSPFLLIVFSKFSKL